MTDEEARNVELTKEYFRRSDAQNPSLFDLFATDLQFYFPKFGIGHGKQAVIDVYAGFAGQMEAAEHDFTHYLFIAQGPYVVVEGTTRGRLNGVDWEAGKTPGGRFCNVFECRDGLITRCHVYLDPDHTGQDEARFRWGREGRSW